MWLGIINDLLGNWWCHKLIINKLLRLENKSIFKEFNVWFLLKFKKKINLGFNVGLKILWKDILKSKKNYEWRKYLSWYKI